MSGNDDEFGIPDFLLRKEKPKTCEGNTMAQTTAPANKPDVEAPKAKGKGGSKGKPAPTVAASLDEPTPSAPKAAPEASTKPTKPKVKLDAYGYRDGSLKSRAAAMYASGKGATLSEVKAALGSVQLNVLTELKKQGYTVENKKEDGSGSRQVTRYKLGTKA